MRNFLYMCYRQNPSNIVDYELVKTNQQANRMILEELNMVNNDRKESMEMEIARQCAPVLAGVKPANILILKGQEDEAVCSCFEGTGISCYPLCCQTYPCDSREDWQSDQEKIRKVWLVYREDRLRQILQQTEYQKFLEKEGYGDFELTEMLEILSLRFSRYQRQNVGFPHEMGIFLGYPLADVKGFIDHKGKNFLYQGYWKVYENVEERKKLFSVYTIVKQEIVKEIEAGKALWQAAVEVRSPYEGLFA